MPTRRRLGRAALGVLLAVEVACGPAPATLVPGIAIACQVTPFAQQVRQVFLAGKAAGERGDKLGMRQASEQLKGLTAQITTALDPALGPAVSPAPALIAMISLQLLAQQGSFFFGEEPDPESLAAIDQWLVALDQVMDEFEKGVTNC